MEAASDTPGAVPLTVVIPMPIEEGDCPGTLVRFTLLPGPVRLLRATGMICWTRATIWSLPSSPKPKVTSMPRGPVTPTMRVRLAVVD